MWGPSWCGEYCGVGVIVVWGSSQCRNRAVWSGEHHDTRSTTVWGELWCRQPSLCQRWWCLSVLETAKADWEEAEGSK